LSFKFKYYAQPVLTNIKTLFESAAIEFSICLICAAFAYASYGEVIQLFLGTAVVSVVCFFLTIYNIYIGIQINRDKKRREQEMESNDGGNTET
jgi:hypothetical protein